MASNVMTVTGTKVSTFAGEPLTYDEPGMAALAWVEIGEITNVGTLGATVTPVTHIAVADGVEVNRKGHVSYGDMAMTLGFDGVDVGQVAIDAAVDGAQKNTIHSLKVEYSSGVIRYVTGMWFAYEEIIGEADSIVGANATFKPDQKPIKVVAA